MPELPNGFDRADGLDGRIGTVTPEGAIRVRSGNGGIDSISEVQPEEAPESPTIERAEQATICHEFTMPWSEAMNQIQVYGRGTLLEDSFGDLTRVLSSEIKHKKGGMAEMKIVSESSNFDPPPDQFQIVPVELGVNILKHPRYFYAFLGDGQGSETEKANQMVIRFLQDYFENTNYSFRDAVTKLLLDSIGNEGASTDPKPPYVKPTTDELSGSFDGLCAGTDLAKRAALEIIQKYWRGLEVPYVVGYQITWTAFYTRPQHLNPGGYVEDPASPTCHPIPVPNYFLSPSQQFETSGETIFDELALRNPQCYSIDGTPSGAASISWLRKADQIEELRMWFKHDRTWIGSPVGFWDEELFNSDERPSEPDDYLVIPTPSE
jgi:hypothetical protein